ncbi:MAG: DinB family protein [Allomuricauda sp.]
MENTAEKQSKTAQVITPSQLLEHWQGHRRVTRRVIEAFPEKEFFTHSIGGMRPFSQMVAELLAIAVPGLQEIVSGKASKFDENLDHDNSKAKMLQWWDEATEQINELWAKIPAEQFQEHVKLFGQYEGPVHSQIFYFIDNEIHHRAQGYVYLRSLGVEPPFFYDRS